MANSKKSLTDFLHLVEHRLEGSKSILEDPSYLDTFPLVLGQAIYVFNWNENLVSYQRGVEDLLGYTTEEFSRELITSSYHPDDYELVSRLMKGGVNYLTNNPISRSDYVYNLTYRVRKKNGEYIKVLRQSAIFEVSAENHMLSNFSILSDISFISTGNKVEWQIIAKDEVKEDIEKYVHEALSSFFSDREMDVLKELKLGSNSRQIAEKLFISKNTVDTHRRNMLKKSGCINTTELIHFAQQNGII